MENLVLIILLVLFLYAFIKGLLIVFINNFWLALLMLIVLPPLFLIWVIVEGILSIFR